MNLHNLIIGSYSPNNPSRTYPSPWPGTEYLTPRGSSSELSLSGQGQESTESSSQSLYSPSSSGERSLSRSLEYSSSPSPPSILRFAGEPISSSLPLNRDAWDILDEFPYPEVLETCQQNQLLKTYCEDPRYWRHRIRKDFGIHPSTTDPPREYQEIYFCLQRRRDIKLCLRRALDLGHENLVNRYLEIIIQDGDLEEAKLFAFELARGDQLFALERLMTYVGDSTLLEQALDGAAFGGHRDLTLNLLGRIFGPALIRREDSDLGSYANGSPSPPRSPESPGSPRRLRLPSFRGDWWRRRRIQSKLKETLDRAIYWAESGHHEELVRELINLKPQE